MENRNFIQNATIGTTLLFCLLTACNQPKSEKIDLSQYDASSPIEVTTKKNALQVIWQSADNTQFRVDFNLSGIDPLINIISYASEENVPFTTLARNIQPDFQITEGILDSRFDVNWPWIFFDDPNSRASKTFPPVIDLKNVEVQSSEGRV